MQSHEETNLEIGFVCLEWCDFLIMRSIIYANIEIKEQHL